MKKIAVLFLFFASSTCYGQFAKGTYGVSIHADYRTTIAGKSWDTEINSTELKVLPSFQYWFNEKISAAIGVGYGTQSSELFGGNNYRGHRRYHRLPLLASVRYWHPIKHFKNRLSFYGELSPSLTLSWYKDEGSNDSGIVPDYFGKGYKTEIDFTAGIFLFITDKFGLDVNIGGFNYNNHEWRSRSNNHSRGTEHHNFRFNLSPIYWQVGIHYLLNSNSITFKEE